MRDALGEKGLKFDDDRRIVAFEEAGRKFEARNSSKQRLLGYRVDGELLSTRSKRACDFLLGAPRIDKIYLIELKGHHLREAVSQLSITIDRLGERLGGRPIFGRIVLSRVSRPDLRSSEVLAFSRKLANLGGDLIYRSAILVEQI